MMAPRLFLILTCAALAFDVSAMDAKECGNQLTLSGSVESSDFNATKIVGHDALSMGVITSLEIKHSCDADSLPVDRARNPLRCRIEQGP